MIVSLLCAALIGQSDVPPPVAPTRTKMKAFLEGSKSHQSRLPFPEVTAEAVAAAKARGGPGGLNGVINNGWMRTNYLPRELTSGGFSRAPDPKMTLPDVESVMWFWIASRGNNCGYCMGHQEVKLEHAGVKEDAIAALDFDWTDFSPAQQVAFAFVRKLTQAPHEVGDEDVSALRKHYNDTQILEILVASGGHNAMNRWTSALHIPQEGSRDYKTPVSSAAEGKVSFVAPLSVPARPALEPRPVVESKLEEARQRTPRIRPLSEEEARKVLTDWPEGPLPEWAKLLATFPERGKGRVALHQAAKSVGELPKLLRAQVAWVAAREDRAWYALGVAQKRLHDLKQTDDQVFALEGDFAGLSQGDRAALEFARKLTSTPHKVSDADVAGLRKHFSDKQVAELVFQVTEAAFFDRVTEPAGLRLDF